MDADDKRGKFSSLLVELTEQIAVGYQQELKMSPENSRRAAELAMEMIKEYAGGGAIYIAKGHLHAITEKHRRIHRRFTGANHAQLAREFGLTERQIYTIVERVGREEFERKQGKLFEL